VARGEGSGERGLVDISANYHRRCGATWRDVEIVAFDRCAESTGATAPRRAAFYWETPAEILMEKCESERGIDGTAGASGEGNRQGCFSAAVSSVSIPRARGDRLARIEPMESPRRVT